jgi:hypothetical protein
VLRSERGRLHEAAESKRLFYVAATRAKERLILVAAPIGSGDDPGDSKGAAPWIAPLGAIGFPPAADRPDGPLDHPDVIQRRIVAPERSFQLDAPRPFEPLPLVAATRAFATAAAAARAPGRRFERPSAQELAAASQPARPVPASGTPADLSRVVGIACHVALARSGPARAPDRRRDRGCGRLRVRRRPLRPGTSHAGGDGAAPCARGHRALFLARAGAGARGRAAAHAGAGGAALRGSADLVIEEAGRIIVADWKSDRVEATRRRRPRDALPAAARIYRDALAAALAPAAGTRDEAAGIELLLLRRDGAGLLCDRGIRRRALVILPPPWLRPTSPLDARPLRLARRARCPRPIELLIVAPHPDDEVIGPGGRARSRRSRASARSSRPTARAARAGAPSPDSPARREEEAIAGLRRSRRRLRLAAAAAERALKEETHRGGRRRGRRRDRARGREVRRGRGRDDVALRTPSDPPRDDARGASPRSRTRRPPRFEGFPVWDPVPGAAGVHEVDVGAALERQARGDPLPREPARRPALRRTARAQMLRDGTLAELTGSGGDALRRALPRPRRAGAAGRADAARVAARRFAADLDAVSARETDD